MQIIAQSYDTKGRIASASFTISGVKKDFHYSYLEGTSLLQTLAHPKGLRTERKYEAQRNLVTDINEMRGASGVSLRGYSYDAIARPETLKISRSGSVRDDKFEYNSRSELIASNHGSDNFPSGAPPLAQSYRLGTPSEESSGLGVKLLKSQFAYDYLPFGGVAESGAYRSPDQWSSEVYDEELALVYYNYRHYKPSDGRWINRDPIGIKGGLNLYGFVGNRVIRYIDYLGLLSEEDSSGLKNPVHCNKATSRYSLTLQEYERALKSLGIYKLLVRVSNSKSTCTGCCKSGNKNGKSISLSTNFQLVGEAGSPEFNFHIIKIRLGWYFRLGGAISLSTSHNTCENTTQEAVCGSLSGEIGAIFSANSMLGLDGGVRGGLKVSVSVCLRPEGEGKVKTETTLCLSGRLRLWASLEVWPFGKADYLLEHVFDKKCVTI